MEVLLFRQDLSVTISITTMRSSKVTITGLPRKRSHLFAKLPSLISHLSSPVSRCMPSQTITLVLSVTVTINSKSISIGTITIAETHPELCLVSSNVGPYISPTHWISCRSASVWFHYFITVSWCQTAFVPDVAVAVVPVAFVIVLVSAAIIRYLGDSFF